MFFFSSSFIFGIHLALIVMTTITMTTAVVVAMLFMMCSAGAADDPAPSVFARPSAGRVEAVLLWDWR